MPCEETEMSRNKAKSSVLDRKTLTIPLRFPAAGRRPVSGHVHQLAASASCLRRMVALLIIGRAQKPTQRTNPNVT
jgi:hypothetical protein